MDEMTFIDKIRKIIKMRHDDVVSSMASGGVDNMEKYQYMFCLLYTSPSPRDGLLSRMPSSA